MSEIVKNNIPELSKIADATKSAKPSAHHKDSTDKSPHSASGKGHGSNKGQGYQKNRPTHLTNGHSDKAVHSKMNGKSAGFKHTDGDSSKGPEKQAPPNKRDSGEAGSTDSKGSTATQVSPSVSWLYFSDTLVYCLSTLSI